MQLVKIKTTSEFEEFLDDHRNDQIVCYGAGRMLVQLVELICPQYHFEQRIAFVVDSNTNLHNTVVSINGREFRVRSMDDVLENATINDLVFCITSLADIDIFSILKTHKKLKNCPVYSLAPLWVFEQTRIAESAERPPTGYRMCTTPQIPKVLNYAWFGGNTMPDKNKRCIDSWRKFCPDYQIVEWNEGNYDVSSHHFPRDAYAARKYAFVADFAKLQLAYQYGGIFLDVDVEIIKNLDELLYNTAYCGFHNHYEVAFGLGLGTVAGLPIVKELLDMYDDTIFSADDTGKLACNILQTQGLQRYGLILNGSFQIIDGLAVYPTEYFNPILFTSGQAKITENTYSAHFPDVSWEDERLTSDRARISAHIQRILEEAR